MLRQAEELAAKYPNTIPVMLDAGSQEGHLDSLVKDHDLVIRYRMHFCRAVQPNILLQEGKPVDGWMSFLFLK